MVASIEKPENVPTGHELIETMKAPVIQMGKDLGFEVLENEDLGAGPVHVVWNFKPGAAVIPDIRLGFICLRDASASTINEAIARGMLNLMDKLVLLTPTDSMTKQVKDSIESMPDKGILQLRKYLTIFTPSTLVSKSEIQSKDVRAEAI